MVDPTNEQQNIYQNLAICYAFKEKRGNKYVKDNENL